MTTLYQVIVLSSAGEGLFIVFVAISCTLSHRIDRHGFATDKLVAEAEESHLDCSQQIQPWSFTGCETWSLTLREERRLRVFENRVLSGGGIFGLTRTT